MLNIDSLQDLLSSIGPYRVESIVRMGFYTTSCKVLDMSNNQLYLFKVRERGSDDPIMHHQNQIIFNGYTIWKRRWVSRCLKDRLYQFPYMIEAERKLIYSFLLEYNVETVKLSNVLLSHWNMVYIVDSEPVYTGDALLDDTDGSLDMIELAKVLQVENGLDTEFDFPFIQSLPLYKPQACFERAAYLTVVKIEEVIDDLLFINHTDLLDLLCLLCLSIVRTARYSSTRQKALLSVKALRRSSLFNYHVMPAMFMVIEGGVSFEEVEKMLALECLLSLYVGNPFEVSKEKIFRAIHEKARNCHLLICKYGQLTGDKRAFDMLLDADMVDLAVQVAFALNIEHTESCLLQLAKWPEKYCQLLVGKVDDKMQVEQFVLKQFKRIPVSCKRILQRAGKLTNQLANMATLDSSPNGKDTGKRQSSSSFDFIELASSLNHQHQNNANHNPFDQDAESARFWKPANVHSVFDAHGVIKRFARVDDKLIVLKEDRIEYYKDVFSLPDRTIPMPKGCVLTSGCVHGGKVYYSVFNNDNQKTILYRISQQEDTVIYETCSSVLDVLSTKLGLVIVASDKLVMISEHDTAHKVNIPLPVTCVSTASPFGSFFLLGTKTGHLILVDTRSTVPIVTIQSHPVKTEITAVAIAMQEWSEKTEHLKLKTWIGTCHGLHLCDLDGRLVDGRGFETDFAVMAIMAPLGANYLVASTDSGVKYYEWRQDKLLDISNFDNQVTAMRIVNGRLLVGFSDGRLMIVPRSQ